MSAEISTSLALQALGAIDPALEAIGRGSGAAGGDEADLARLKGEFAADAYATFDPRAHISKAERGFSSAIRRFAKDAVRWSPDQEGACRCHEPPANFIYKAARLVLTAERLALKGRYAEAANLYTMAMRAMINVRGFGDRSHSFMQRTAFAAGVLAEHAGDMHSQAGNTNDAVKAYIDAAGFFKFSLGKSDSEFHLVARVLRKVVDIHLDGGNFAAAAHLCYRASFMGEYVIDRVYPPWFAGLKGSGADLETVIIPILKDYVDLCLRVGRLDDAERKLEEFNEVLNELQGEDRAQLLSEFVTLWESLAGSLNGLADYEMRNGNDAEAGKTWLRCAKLRLHAKEIAYRRSPWEADFSCQHGVWDMREAKWSLRRALEPVPAQFYELSARELEMAGFLSSASRDAWRALAHYTYYNDGDTAGIDVGGLTQMIARLDARVKKATSEARSHRERALAFEKEEPPRYDSALKERELELRAMMVVGRYEEDEFSRVVDNIIRLAKITGGDSGEQPELRREFYMKILGGSLVWLARDGEMDDLIGRAGGRISEGEFENALDALTRADDCAKLLGRGADISEMKARVLERMARKRPSVENSRNAAASFCEAAGFRAEREGGRRAGLLYEASARNCITAGDRLGAAMSLGFARDHYEWLGQQGEANRVGDTIHGLVSGGGVVPAGGIISVPPAFLPLTAFEMPCVASLNLPCVMPVI